ncbi:MAG: rhamnogalacturonan acetylesterase [Odoribacter sp.]|nr:rhamnogalacturonan acetylesterase [Odoribacter sp.]
MAGSTRKKGKPVIFLVGDSTVKNGQGKGDGGQWGWGSFFEQYVDTTQVSVENHALGGTSSRTFITGRFWEKVLPGIQEGDYVLIQFGHNDGGTLNTGRARASLKGTGDEMETVIMERTGGPETVYTFGYYLRRYIRQSKAQGAIPVVLSPTPVNRWTGERINRYNETYTRWAREVAEQEGVGFIDLNELTAVKYEKMGKEAAQEKMFKDSVHTSQEGALLNCESVCEGIRQLENLNLKQYLKTSR